MGFLKKVRSYPCERAHLTGSAQLHMNSSLISPTAQYLFKLKSKEILGNLLTIMSDFLANRYQRVALNSKTSELTPVNVGVLQGSIPDPVLIYIND